MKKKKVIRIITIILFIIIIGELIYMGALSYKNEKNSVYYTFINKIIEKENGFVGAGNSDLKYSKKYNLQNNSKALVNIYNEDFKVKDEIILDIGYDSFYNDIVKVEDGYIAVGAIEMTKQHNEENYGEGLIVKYDNDFKQVFRKNFNILGNTEFTKVKTLNDGSFLVVGKSVYEPYRMGNHETGGAILVKFDKDGNELLRANYTGPYNGIFTDVLVEEDGYVACGNIKDNTGVIIKYDLKGKEMWHYHYSYTDNVGFTSINKINHNYVLTGSKLDVKGKLDYYKASIVIVNEQGKKVNDITYQSSNITRFNNLLVEEDKILVAGVTGVKKESETITDAILITLDKDLKVIDKEILSYENNESYNNIIKLNNKNYLLGYTNSKIKGIKSNNKDYFPIIKEVK